MTVPPEQHDDALEFDPIFAGELVDITSYRRLDQTSLRRDQFYGRVVSADAAGGIKLELGGKNEGDVKWLPPQTDVFEPVAPGFYELHDDQDTMDNPDHLAMWNVYMPDT